MFASNIERHWVDWYLENIALGVEPKVLVVAMLAAKISEDEVLLLVNNAHRLAGYRTALKLGDQLRKLESVNINHQKLVEQDPERKTIGRVSGLTKESFFQDYWVQNRPVIITDLLDNCTDYKKWTVEYLLENYADEVVEIQEGRTSDPEYEINSPKHKSTISMSKFIKRILNSDESNDFYMTANNFSVKNSGLGDVLDCLQKLPDYCVPPTRQSQTGHIWVGPKGTITPLHHDESGILHPHLSGSKRWIMISPQYATYLYNNVAVFSDVDIFNINYDKYPKMRDVNVIDITLNAGESLFIPVNWWHAVQSLSPCVSLTLTGFPFHNEWTFYKPVRR
jgi:hypothetical protein